MKPKNQIVNIAGYILLAGFLRYVMVGVMDKESLLLKVIAIAVIFGVGIVFVFRGTANIIEETTDVLKDRTGLAGGFLQSFGTAFPDMIIGVTAAILSLSVRESDMVRSINLAIIAAAATFGSNIYNIIHAVWCLYRQNLSDTLGKAVLMFPPFKIGGKLTPINGHSAKPTKREMDSAIDILSVLTILTASVAILMVIFGQVKNLTEIIEGDIYELTRPVGIFLLLLCLGTLYYFRKSERPQSLEKEIVEEEKYYTKQKTVRIWLDLVLSGIAILFAAESMVRAMEVFAHLTHLPFVATGILAGIIGCFGEMLVVHNFSVNPKGRIGDAVVGVAMDNIVTTMGAAIVAVMGGIFLGGNSLIVIFMIILAGNTILIQQISRLKNGIK
jgi:MFS family permease